VCQKDPGLAYKNVIVNVVFIEIQCTLLNKLQKVAEIAYTPSIPEKDKKISSQALHLELQVNIHDIKHFP